MVSVPHFDSVEAKSWAPKNGELVHTVDYGANRPTYIYIGRSGDASFHVLESADPTTFFKARAVYPVISHAVIVDGTKITIGEDMHQMLMHSRKV